MNDVIIRNATPSDASALLEIYAPYVLNSVYTFETEPPTVEEFTNRVEEYSHNRVYLVAEDTSGGVVGYAYAKPFGTRAAYAFSVESSVYVREAWVGMKVGSKLYTELLTQLKVKGIRMCIAILGMPNDASLAFHKSFGFTEVGALHNVGYKFGHWLDTAYLELEL